MPFQLPSHDSSLGGWAILHPPTEPHPLSQMFPLATVVGNTFVMKPSEQDPGACMLLAQMALDAGLPDGVLNIIHGQKEGEAERG